MRRLNLKMMMAMLLLPVGMLAQQEYGTVLSESFEKGIPEAWSQENVSGDRQWVAESGDTLSYPSGAEDGVMRVALRNNSDMTEGYVTKLVTPEMNLKGLYQPIVCFGYASDQWTNDFDTLVVYYRTSPENEWTELKRYDSYAPEWVRDTIALNSTETETFQIAFEGRDNLGRGIVIDDVEVRSTPNCKEPYGLYVNYVSNDSVELCWRAGYDSERFAVRIDTAELDGSELYDGEFRAAVKDTVIDGGSYGCFGIGGLSAGKGYYAYIKSLCRTGESGWSDVFRFETTNMADIPYSCDFNMNLVPGYFAEPDGWLCFSSADSKQAYVNTAMSQYDISAWSRDKTTSLVFGTESSYPQPIPGEEYAYAVTPEIKNENVGGLQVSFWSVNPNYTSANYRIIVGAMTIPEDISTFEPVDTVYINSYRQFEKVTVYMSDYDGDGRYIALMSRFDDANMFVIDDLTIDVIPKCPVPSQIRLSVMSSDGCRVSWEAGGADKVDIVFSEACLESITEDDVTHKEVGNDYEAKGLKPWTKYYVYVRSVNGGNRGEWSEPVELMMPDMVETMPHTYDFEIDLNDNSTFYFPHSSSSSKIPNELLIRQNHTSYPNVVNQQGGKTLQMTITQEGRYTCVIFPELADIRNTQVSFYPRLYNPSYETGTIYAGVIGDVNDMGTFVCLDTIVLGSNDQRCLIRLDGYDGDGRFFALKMLYAENGQRQTAYVDNVKFEEIPPCIEPEGIRVESGTNSAKFSWNEDASVSGWRLILSKTELEYDDLERGEFGDLALDTVITDMPFTISNLEDNETEYWYSMQFSCDIEKGQWTEPAMFVTKCAGNESLPYVLDFEGYQTGSLDKFAVPCIGTELVGVQNAKYPRLEGSGYYVYQGKASLALSSSAGNPGYPVGYNSYIALPDMNETKTGSLILSMFIKSSSSDSEIEVGVMGDGNDRSTYDSVTTISGINSQWQEVVVPLLKYQGEKRHIAIMTKEGTSSAFYIDSITVFSRGECPVVYTVECESASDTSAILRWDKGEVEKEWQMVVTAATMDNAQLDEALSAGHPTAEIPFADNVMSNRVEVKGLADNTRYYVYVRTVCADGEEYGQWSMKPGEFRTACRLKSVDELGTEGFDTYGIGLGNAPSCWTVGSIAENALQYNMPYCSGEYAHGGSGASLMFSTSSSMNGAFAVSPKIDVDDIRRVQVSFWGTSGRNSSPRYQRQIAVGVLTDLTDITSFVPVDTVTGYGDEQYYTVQLSGYDGDYNKQFGKYVMFMSEFGKENTFFIDDVKFSYIPECPAPCSIQVDSVADDCIGMSWTDDEKRPYVVRYATRPLTEDELASDGNDDVLELKATDMNVTLTGLAESTEYYIYIAAECDGGLMWSPVIRVRTECHPVHSLPVREDFDSYTMTGDYFNPECWLSYYNVLYQENKHPHIAPNGRAGNCLYVCEEGLSAPSYAVSPEVDIDDISRCQVSFYAKNAPYNHLYRSLIVGVVSDISSGERIMETFVPVDTILQVQPNANEFSYHNVSLEGYTGDGRHVAFTTSRDLNAGAGTGSVAGMYIDNIEIEVRPSCQRPDDVRLMSVSDVAAKISFSEIGSADSWIVRYGKAGFDVTYEGMEMPADSTVFTVEGLEPFTEYDVYVRSVCGVGDSSVWEDPLTVRTLHSPVSVYPYNSSFEDDGENGKWMFYNGTQKNAWHVGQAISKNDGGKSLYISNDNGISSAYSNGVISYTWAARSFRLNTGIYTFDFDWTCQGSYTNAFMRAGLLPLSAAVAAGSNTVVFDGGRSAALQPYQSGTPAEWICLEGTDSKTGSQRYVMNNVLYGEEKNWAHNTVTILVTDSMAGDYNFMVYWYNASYGSGPQYNPSAVIDNIGVTYEECIYPVGLKVDTLSTGQTTVTWNKIGDKASGWEVFVTSDPSIVSPDAAQPDDVEFREETSDMEFTMKELKPWTEYRVFVRAKCGDTKYSNWSESVSFRTECTARPADTRFGFEEEEKYYTGYDQSHKIPECFVSGNAKLGVWDQYNYENFPYMKQNSDREHVSRTGNYALHLISKMMSQEGGYIAFPQIEGDLDTMQITFWMRSGVHSPETGLMSVYRKSEVSVGVMSDVYDPTSFRELKRVAYPLELTSASNVKGDGNQFWVKVSVPLTGSQGGYVTLMSMADGSMSGNEVYIDDVVFEAISVCAVPYDIEVRDTTSTGASVTFDHYNGDAWVYHIAKSHDMTDTVKMDTVHSSTFDVEGLIPASGYYIAIRQLCGDEKSEWSLPKGFFTDFTVKFEEEFEIGNERVPEQWQRATQDVADVLSGETELWYIGNSDNRGWSRSDSKVLGSHHMVMSTTLMYGENLSVSSTSSNWLVTPVIDMRGEQGAALTFRMALTLLGSEEPILNTMKGQDGNRFMVMISGDGGTHWETLAEWSNDGNGRYVFDDISATGESVKIDLSRYTGRRIRVGFYTQALGTNLEADFHIDDVTVNGIVEKRYEFDLCETEDFTFKGFRLRGNELTPGENNAEYLEATDSGVRDTLHLFSINVSPMVGKLLEVEICENGSYTENGFNASVEGVYKRKKKRTGGCCDSVTVLNLTVVPAAKTYMFDTICRGGSIIWQGEEIDRGGVYYDTLQSVRTKCDSIIIMTLTVSDALEYEVYDTICAGEEYIFGNMVLTESGRAQYVFESADKCDSVVNLNLTVLPDLRQQIDAVICVGERYNDNGFNGVDETGTHILPLESANRCDSTKTLNLIVINPEETVYVERKITPDDLPFDFFGKVFDENTADGVHEVDVEVSTDGCSGTVHLTLTIGTETGNVTTEGSQGLTLTPNPVRVHESVMVHKEFTTVEISGMTVSVYNNAGMLLRHFEPVGEPIVIDGFEVTGVYLVRIVDGNGKVYVGKVIVR